jgi:squalene synthase HpnC
MAVDHYENFPVASLLLPQRFRRPVALIYRFAREADDIADEGDAPASVRLAQLDHFREEIRRIEAGAEPRTPWFSELADVIRAYGLPSGAFLDLLSAFAQDVTKRRYAEYGEVMDYCSRSANPVGRLLLVLYGAPEPRHLKWSDAICSSLQLINFLQDIGVDFEKGRIYLPADEMHAYGITEAQIEAADTGGRWREFMRFQVERARALLASGAPLGRALTGRLGLEMRMIIAGGARILEKIDAVQGDVFRHRPVLKPLDWPLMFTRAW